MGYYTRYEMKVDGDISFTGADLEEVTDYPWERNKDSFFIEDEVKWYDSNDHMLKFSKEHSNNLFELHCKGEEGEEYIVYYKDGKTKTVEPITTWPTFNEKDLE